MSFIDRYEQTLLDAANRHLHAPHPRPSMPRRVSRRVVLVAVGISLMSGTAIAARAVWAPSLGDSDRGHPTPARTAPPSDQLDHFAVLRRPAQPPDHAAAVTDALRLLDPDVDGVRINSIRVLRPELGRGALVLIPVRRYNVRVGLSIPPGAPASLKAGLAPKSDGLCLFKADPVPGAGGALSCRSTTELLTGAPPAAIGGSAYDLVPDAVSRIEVRFTDGRTIRQPIRDNSYAYRPPAGATTAEVRWLDEAGQTIRSFTPH